MHNVMSIDEVKAIYNVFDRDFSSIVISTITKDKNPQTSYAPFVKVNDSYYIIISETADHYHNMMRHNQVSIMFIQDELATNNVFFRRKMTFNCLAIKEQSSEARELFTELHGDLVDMLLDKMDFHLFKLEVLNGRIVLGPGKAFSIENNEITQYRGNSKGHSSSQIK